MIASRLSAGSGVPRGLSHRNRASANSAMIRPMRKRRGPFTSAIPFGCGRRRCTRGPRAIQVARERFVFRARAPILFLPMSITQPLDLVSTKNTKTALVVGASSGIGAALVKQLVAEGYAVCAIARRKDALDALAREVSGSNGGRLVVHAHDVARAEEVPQLFEQIVRELGGLELVIYAAGIMPKIGLKEYDTEKDLDQLIVNV